MSGRRWRCTSRDGVFLLLTSVVAVWRDWQNGTPTIATAWNVTNTVILALLIGAAARESKRSPAPAIMPEPVETPLRTVVSRPAPRELETAR